MFQRMIEILKLKIAMKYFPVKTPETKVLNKELVFTLVGVVHYPYSRRSIRFTLTPVDSK